MPMQLMCVRVDTIWMRRGRRLVIGTCSSCFVIISFIRWTLTEHRGLTWRMSYSV